MRMKIRHDTVFQFEEPARSALNILRLTPRNTDCQFVKRWRIEIDGDARLDRGEDAHGNITHTVFVEGPLSHLRITVDGEVDTADTNGIMRGTVERLPLPLFLRPSALTLPSPAILAWSEASSAASGNDRLATLHRLMADLHRDVKKLPAAIDLERAVEAVFAERHGSASDLAHVLVAAARGLGVPARIVTGYLYDDDQGTAHAWMEAWVERVGWIGFDPAKGVCVTDRYVRVASGLDLLDAAPVRGANLGSGPEALRVSVQIDQGRQIVEA
jgi:transglutaminase-like putative cysteine protease